MQTNITPPNADDARVLRHVRTHDGHVLLLWDTYRTDRHGKSVLGYAFTPAGTSEPLFAGEDFHASPLYAIDADQTLVCLLAFLALRPGDTDREYFEAYTPTQMAWAESSACEGLQADLAILESPESDTDRLFAELYFSEVGA